MVEIMTKQDYLELKVKLENVERLLYQIQGQKKEEPEQIRLNHKECAKMLGISVAALYKMTSKGDIPYYKPTGGKNYFIKSEIEEWIQNRRKRKPTNTEIETMAVTYCATRKRRRKLKDNKLQ